MTITPPSVLSWDGRSTPDLLALEQLDRDLFRNRLNQRNANGALFGGQVLAQALTAATHSVEDSAARPVHSLHGYFLRAGRCHLPVIYQVDRTRDGGRFSTRRVIALQDGQPIFHMECGFHAPEDGFDHAAPIHSGLPHPDSLQSLAELADTLPNLPDWVRDRWKSQETPVIAKPLDPPGLITPGAPRRRVWVKLPALAAAASASEQACMLAYLSDYWLAGTAANPHTLPMASPDLFMASIDHAMWFHRPVDVTDWLLFDCDSPSAQAGRGLSRALIHDIHGRLVASTAQESLMRARRL